MRILRYAVLLLVFLLGTDMWGQYNPTNPTEPGAAPWKLTLRSIPSDAGSFNINKVTSWAAGVKVSLSANNNGNYIFQQWENVDGTIASEKSSFSIVMPSADTVLVARYVYKPSSPSEPSVPVNYATVNISASPSDGGSTNPSGSNRYQVGTKVTIKASNNSNFLFKNWTENGQVISTSSTLSNYEVKENGGNLVANFAYAPGNPGEPAVAVVSHPLYLKANPDGACSFNITSGTRYQEGTSVKVRANANTYYTFKNWTIDGEVISNSSEFNFTMPKYAVTLVANYSYNYNPGSPNEPGVATTERLHIYGMHEEGIPGQTIKYPVYLENTSSLTGFSIDVAFPSGFTVDASSATLTDRTSGHTVEVESLGDNAFRFFIRGSEVISGANGKVIEIPLTIPDTEEVGTFYTIGLSKGAVFKSDGSQTVVTVRSGSLKIQPSPDAIPDSPDFTISDIMVNESETGPGEMIHLSWKVNNIGQLGATSGWSERIYLVSSTGKKVNIGTTYYDTSQMDAGTSVSREADIALGRLLGIEGETYVSITIVPNGAAGEITERQSNNTADNKGNTLLVNKQLYLTLPEKALTEGETTTAKCQLARSGNWTATEVFDLSVLAGDTRLQLPATVSIPKNQSSVYFFLTVANNELLDESAHFNVQASGNGYTPVTGNLMITDDEKPALTLASSNSDVSEGDSFELTVSVPRVPTSDVVVNIVTEYPKRFTFPSQVILPAGQTFAKIAVSVVNDDIPSIQLSNTFTVSAEGYTNGEAIVILNDDDIPALELTLTPNRVSEGDGVASVAGVLRRTGKTNNKITVKLTDNANGGLYFGNRTLELAKGVEEVHFNFGPVDNAKVDGDRTYTISAAVWVSSCNCSASGESAGSVTADLEVFDDDGATLSITSSLATMKEGGKTILTITRNTDTSKALTVTLNSDYDDNLTYNHTVIIPVGQKSETVEVISKGNDVIGDTHTVVFTVAADGYSSGTCYLMVTDQTLPDARISSIISDIGEATVGEEATLTVIVTNDGAVELPAGITVKLYHRGESSAIATLYTQNPIAVGGSETLVKSIALPATVGSHRYYAVVNEAHKVNELSYTNNTSSEAVVKTIAPFTVTVNTDKKIYQQGEKVTITGQLTGNNTSDADIDLYLINEGARQVKKVKTDSQGAFSYVWELYALQSGHFSVGACYPDEGVKTEMAAFDVYGLRRTSNGYIKCDVDNGSTFTGKLSIINPGNLDLTGVTVSLLSAPANCEASFSVPQNIKGGETVNLTYSMKGLAPSSEVRWDEVKARINTAEGTSLDITLYFYCRVTTGKLVPLVKKINTTMTKGKSREYNLQVTNAGRGNTGNITLSLPAFIKSLSGTSLPSLDQNDTLNIALSLSPLPNMQLNVPVTGQLGINCSNGDGAAVSFSITPVSEETGTLVIDVCDEYSYYTSEAPHVAGAEVVVRNPVTKALVAQGKTGVDGKYAVVLPEGYYNISVTADKHDSYTNNICVDPGTETVKTINLSVESITVDWKVEEAEVEDEYEIVTTVKYETNVPTPVVEMTVPRKLDVESLADGESLVFTAILTNKGLIKAEDAELILPTDVSGISLEPLSEYKGLTIAPQQSISIPVKLTKEVVSGSRVRKASPTGISCSFKTYTIYYWDCGDDRKWHRYGYDIQIRICNRNTSDPSNPSNSNSDPWLIGSGDSGGPGSPGGSSSNSYYNHSTRNNTISQSEDKGCEPCQNGYLIAGTKCALRFGGDAYDTAKKFMGMFFENIDDDDEKDGWEQAADNTDDIKKQIDELAERIEKSGLFEKSIAGDLRAVSQNLEGVSGILNFISKGNKAFNSCAKLKEKENRKFDNIHECYKNISETVDAFFDEGISGLAGKFGNIPEAKIKRFKSLGKKLMKWKKWADIGMDCANDFVHACDHIRNITNAVRTRSSQNSNKSYIDSYVNNVELFIQGMNAYSNIFDKVWGEDEAWEDVSVLELELLAMIDYSQSFDSLMTFKPESMPDAVYLDFCQRRKSEMTHGWSDAEANELSSLFAAIANMNSHFEELGYSDPGDYISSEFEHVMEILDQSQNSVCASITLQFKQTMTMTRQAFRGTLTVFNGNETTAMTDMKLTLNVTSSSGQTATTHEFQINPESLDGFTGELNLTDGWSLAANSTGTATILFIPTKFAAPTEPVDWSFGGTLSYIDPFTGLEVTRELYPVTLTVKPSPELDLTYFMQRDIYGDDALTLDKVEPMVPAEFALLINNKGNGDATNVRMVTQQPEIIENEKGLHIDFEIVSSQVNGGEANLAFGKSIANDFGTIPAHSQSYAQWWLTSTMLAHFTEYDVQANHVTSYGNEDLSLLGDVTIHEMIRSLDLSTDSKKMVGFLVNDITDSEDMPDMLYFSNGETATVSIAAESQMSKTSLTTYNLTITPSEVGWTYGTIKDPTHGIAELKSIVRQRDGKEISLRNFWQTDRTLRDGKDPIYEYKIHFADEFISTSPETYVLTFEAVPDVLLGVEAINGVPEDGTVAEEPVNQLTVKFTKKIVPETFTSDDITFAVQGTKQDTKLIGITTEDNENFNLDLTTLTAQCPNGYYTMTVQTADITDNEGYQGKDGKQAGWILFRGGLVQLITSAWPVNSGTVTRKPDDVSTARKRASEENSENTAKYGSTVVLVANASTGYEFSNWSLNGEVVSTKPEYEALAISDLNIVANFTKKSYQVDVERENEGGTVTGMATGIYVYETPVELTAMPGEDFVFKYWTVNGEVVSSDANTLSMKVDKNLDIKPVFVREYFRQTMTFSRGWNWLSSYLKESIAVDELPDYINRIIGQTDEIIKDPLYGLVGNLSELAPGKAYKIEASRVFNNTSRGHLYDASTSPLTLHKGWNWIAYPYLEQTPLNQVVSNASEGDYITSQSGFAEYNDGKWTGTLDTFVPGNGYLYKSVTEKNLTFDFSSASLSRVKSISTRTHESSSESVIDIHRYPNTMNITLQLFRDGMPLRVDEYNVYAMSDGEIRGIGKQVGDKCYLTVYGSDPVDITFVVESALTSETFESIEVLKFRDDVVGSCKNPFALNIGNSTGIDILQGSGVPMTVYSLQGTLISSDATWKMLQRLPKGVYIVNGQKCFIK